MAKKQTGPSPYQNHLFELPPDEARSNLDFEIKATRSTPLPGATPEDIANLEELDAEFERTDHQGRTPIMVRNRELGRQAVEAQTGFNAEQLEIPEIAAIAKPTKKPKKTSGGRRGYKPDGTRDKRYGGAAGRLIGDEPPEHERPPR